MFVDITQALRTTGRLILPMQLNGILPDQNQAHGIITICQHFSLVCFVIYHISIVVKKA